MKYFMIVFVKVSFIIDNKPFMTTTTITMEKNNKRFVRFVFIVKIISVD